jgi:hypothetical protein
MPTTVQPVLVTPSLPLLLAFYKALLGAVEVSRVPEDGPAFYVGLRIGNAGRLQPPFMSLSGLPFLVRPDAWWPEAGVACAWLWQPAQTSVCGCGNLHKGVCTLPQPHHFTLVDIDNYGRNIRITRAEHPHQKSYHVTHGALADTSAEAPAGRERQPG